MRIEVKGRNVPVPADLREHIVQRFHVIDRQVSELAELEVEVMEEHNPSNPLQHVVHATLHVMGVTLRACKADRDLMHAIHVVSDELAVQVKRHREKRRARRISRSIAAAVHDGTFPGLSSATAA